MSCIVLIVTWLWWDFLLHSFCSQQLEGMTTKINDVLTDTAFKAKWRRSSNEVWMFERKITFDRISHNYKNTLFSIWHFYNFFEDVLRNIYHLIFKIVLNSINVSFEFHYDLLYVNFHIILRKEEKLAKKHDRVIVWWVSSFKRHFTYPL